MKHVWLATNRRIWTAAAIPPAVVFVGGAILAALVWDGNPWARGVGVGASAIALLGLLIALHFRRQPRIALAGQDVLFYVRLTGPVRIPLDVVECFLMGHGPALLPGEHHRKTETVTIVVRLAERAEEWSRGQTHPLLAAWCDGYITIRGTWCEPLGRSVVDRLNRLLHEAQTQRSPAASRP